jgi:hypothetical protein
MRWKIVVSKFGISISELIQKVNLCYQNFVDYYYLRLNYSSPKEANPFYGLFGTLYDEQSLETSSSKCNVPSSEPFRIS